MSIEAGRQKGVHPLISFDPDCCYQGLNETTKAVALYKAALHQDNTCVEAIACIATHYFYSDQPEIALKFYRYVCNLELSLASVEVYLIVICQCWY